ncbi:class I SAM-dependent methyltransferase [Desulfoluna sp.]|uniref:class I SAM-dependent methyltransferase n=1 Tax=Desulfoluna sp. TaxID=2045199 RepID=UPI00260E9C6A|nr:class I SAM-dependent methyltransferase [Desulfoluna sp.]
MKLSARMIKAGWNIVPERDGSYTVHASKARKCIFSPATGRWSVPLARLEQALASDMEEIAAHTLSPMITASKLTALDHTRQSSQSLRLLCSEGRVKGRTVLHLGAGREHVARRDLLAAGAREVADYDPNFYPDKQVLEQTYDVVIASYVLNILPPEERHEVYRDIERCLKSGGRAYLTVQGVWPVENKYQIIGRHADGYLIKTGHNTTFRKGYDPKVFLEEIRGVLGGEPEVIRMFYSNTLAAWTKTEVGG